nr:immunoglobulin light chain junction region [Macaca mulatta]MPO10352.1 immunoglobulin light chain junction region [Macaca mulatta]MPO11195.1 immunoglobulin light chain junction region [Macaca mulatta]MPO13893.1 immunoglobulin light chain junction region [Macaca mulatta]
CSGWDGSLSIHLF